MQIGVPHAAQHSHEQSCCQEGLTYGAPVECVHASHSWRASGMTCGTSTTSISIASIGSLLPDSCRSLGASLCSTGGYERLEAATSRLPSSVAKPSTGFKSADKTCAATAQGLRQERPSLAQEECKMGKRGSQEDDFVIQPSEATQHVSDTPLLTFDHLSCSNRERSEPC